MSATRRAVVFATELADGEFIGVHAVPVENALDVARTDPVHEWTLLPLLLAVEEGLLDAA